MDKGALAIACVKLLKLIAIRMRLGANRNEVVICARTLAHLYVRRGEGILVAGAGAGDDHNDAAAALVDEALIISATVMHLTLALVVAPQPIDEVVGASLQALSEYSKAPHETLAPSDLQVGVFLTNRRRVRRKSLKPPLLLLYSLVLRAFSSQFQALKNSIVSKQGPVLVSCGYKVPSVQSSPSFYVLLLCDRLKLAEVVVTNCLLDCEAAEDEGRHIDVSPDIIAVNILSNRHSASIDLIRDIIK